LQAQVVRNGERVRMYVEITGTPEPTVTWYKDDKPLDEIMKSPHKIDIQGICHTLTIEKGTD